MSRGFAGEIEDADADEYTYTVSNGEGTVSDKFVGNCENFVRNCENFQERSVAGE